MPMTDPTALELVAQSVENLDKKIDHKFAGFDKRVSKVELWQARADGFRAAFNWLPPVAAAIAASGLTALIGALIH